MLLHVFRRYIVKGYLAANAVLLLALIIVISIAMMVEDAQMLSQTDNSFAYLAEVIFLRAFTYGYQLLPIAAFLGALVFGALIAKRGELTALYVGGYSTWQIGRPIIGTALLMAVFTLWAGQVSIPWATNRLVALRGLDSAVRQQAGPSLEQWFKNGDYILHLPGVSIEEKKLIDVLIFRQNTAGEIIEWINAAALQYVPDSAGNQKWLLKEDKDIKILNQ